MLSGTVIPREPPPGSQWKSLGNPGGGAGIKCIPKHLKVQGHGALPPHSPWRWSVRKKPEAVEGSGTVPFIIRMQGLRACPKPWPGAPRHQHLHTGCVDNWSPERVPEPAPGPAWYTGTGPAWAALGSPPEAGGRGGGGQNSWGKSLSQQVAGREFLAEPKIWLLRPSSQHRDDLFSVCSVHVFSECSC